MPVSWPELAAGLLSGGALVKILGPMFAEFRRRREDSKSARALVDFHLDPILKAADELVGKLRSLAQSDFDEIISLTYEGITIDFDDDDADLDEIMKYGDILYLLAQFWAQIQILRIEGLNLNLTRDKRGAKLRSFFRALEARRTRLVDRAWQRAIGEALIDDTGARLRTITLYEFIQRYKSSPDFRDWLSPLFFALLEVEDRRERQRFLVYGAIIHSLLDTLDPRYQVSTKRTGWANKLNDRSRRDLKRRVFAVYLPFVKKPGTYYSVDR
ncbi:MAG: hypothetical protein GY906_35715 [bacterium]|nr:hypothetical protein [bacterium]